MNWDKRAGSIHYVASGLPIDMDSPPAIGDLADLTMLAHDFRVEITAIAGDSFTGTVRQIGPKPTIEACGIKRDDTVMFNESNIKLLHRQGGDA